MVSTADRLGKWFIRYGIWVLVVVVILSLITAGIITWATGNTPPKKSFKAAMREAEEYLYSQVSKDDAVVPTRRVGKFESKGEAEARRVLRQYFNRPTSFGNVRPDFLNNAVTGGTHNLEIDCWDPELKLGVEYNGRQHYEYTPHFHKNREAFMNQKYRDELKRRMCRDHGVTLIEIPNTVSVGNIESFLRSRLASAGFYAT